MHRTERLVIRDLNEEASERKKAEALVNGVLNSSISGIIAYRSIRNPDRKITDFEIILSNPPASRYISGNYDISPHRTADASRLSEIYPHNYNPVLFTRYLHVADNNTSFHL